jgi:subtilase family serine protease
MPGGFWPSDIASAYSITGSGAGATIAIVDAYDSPNAEADLATFSSTFGLPACTTANGCFKKVDENGGTSYPKRNSGWEIEINLDTQWVHAVAPGAKIILVEAASSNTRDLLTAVVSMSWGGSESRSQSLSDSSFNVSGVTFLASSGDTGGLVEWPSSSPFVIAVGGTNLAVSSTTGRVKIPVVETAWSGSGGGCSSVEAALTEQKGFVPTTCTRRGVPDVSMDGGGSSAVAVQVSLQGGWYDVYGTSLAVQLYAGVVGIANSGRTTHLSSTLVDLYTAAKSSYLTDFRDITSGTAGRFTAGTGWDFVTGLGSPLANALIPYLQTVSK